ncbi:MAG: AAC(3) family N-acetyltransferase [Oscillospiraceae bacterium]|nr:AAC(3) family N-acetyltransferase [Oscillospiraceae bacterium]
MVTKDIIKNTLKELGITADDIVLVHSSLKSMGHVDGGAETVIDAFLEVLGEDGTLVMPTLVQNSFGRAYYDWMMNRKSDVGLITETFRLRPGVSRSDQATHSVVAYGKYAEELTRDHGAFGHRYGPFGNTPFAVSSPWQKLYDMPRTKVVFIGVTMMYNTLKHLIEYKMVEEVLNGVQDANYRDSKRAQLRHYARFEEGGLWPFYSSEQMQYVLEEAGLVRKAQCGNATYVCSDVKPMCDFTEHKLKTEPEKWMGSEMAQWFNECR